MLYYILLMISIIFADQLTKWIAVISLKGNESFRLIDGVFHFTYVENRGSAFGMLKDQRWVFMTVSTVAIIGFLAFLVIYYKKLSNLARCSISFIIAGGIGNMIDRVLLGYVVDFFDFALINFAVFNVADSFVSVGAVLFCVWFIIETIKDSKSKKRCEVFEEVDPKKYAPSEETAPAEPTPENAENTESPESVASADTPEEKTE